tara:strand:- start:3577 stop:5973 length:2397 start_codon:yes stop_codon:yes gene_type:complete
LYQKRFIVGVVAIFACLLSSWRILPQAIAEKLAPEVQGGIQGIAIFPGPANEPVPGADVVLASEENDSRFVTAADFEGRFAILNVPPGRYRLHVSLLGVGSIEEGIAIGNSVEEVVMRLAFADEIIEVVGNDAEDRGRQSAEAVQVVDTKIARTQSADLGEVLARTQGVGVRRSGGLGSGSRLSLGGLQGDQIRFFLDGVPLHLSGYPFGLANVPVNLVKRIEIFKGVVPIRFGADALGGAVNVQTEDVQATGGAVSYQAGSFGTHRVTASARHFHEASGFFASASAFFDHADNDYKIDVDAPDERGQLQPVRVKRFHDAYRAQGAVVEAGVVAKEWADRFLLRAFISEFDKELAHNVVMTVPYGDVEYGERTSGASLRFEEGLGDALGIDAVAGVTQRRTRFLDVGTCVYDWNGTCVRVRRQPGEIGSGPRDQVQWQQSGFARLNTSWTPKTSHAVRVSLAPTYINRTGDERYEEQEGVRDPLSAKRNLYTLVSGLEYEYDAPSDDFDAVAFMKYNLQFARTEEALPGGVFRKADRESREFGAGGALRYEFFQWLSGKASYEWATRLPRADEIFGDGALVDANLDLVPERSHNANIGLAAQSDATPVGDLRLEVNGFIRDAEKLIVLLGNDRQFGYDNVFEARSVGVEVGGTWTSPRQYVALNSNVTYQDFRNTSSEGSFGAFEGDRIPNRPYLFANAAARLQVEGIAPSDTVALNWNSRYVHSFFRSWESVGARSFKQDVDAQLTHSLGLSYLAKRGILGLSFTAEVQNITDSLAYDFFGVQRPGRAFYLKTTGEF